MRITLPLRSARQRGLLLGLALLTGCVAPLPPAGNSPAGLSVPTVLPTATAAPPAAAFQPSPTPHQEGTTVADLYTMPGSTIAQGTNTTPAGFYQLQSYRVVELTLPRPLAVEVNGQALTVSKAWRVTVTGGPFTVRALPPTLWLDQTPLGFGQESPDLTAISTVVYDRAVLREGSTLALSYGLDDPVRTEVPEQLHFAGRR